MSDCSNDEVANIAEDAEINQYLDNQLDSCITPQKLELPEKLGSREYYRRLMNNESPKVKVVNIGVYSENGDSGNEEYPSYGKVIDDHSK